LFAPIQTARDVDLQRHHPTGVPDHGSRLVWSDSLRRCDRPPASAKDTQGFDNGWWSTVLGETTFLCDYGAKVTTGGVLKCNLSTPQQAAGTGVGPAGIVLGCLISIYVNEYFGRKQGLNITAIVSMVGIIIEMTFAAGAKPRYGQFVAGKVINSIGMGLTANIVPIYLSETSTSSARGSVINMYQTVQIIGAVVAGGVVYAVFHPE
jgi:SP family sugar:H+ symporter-like MFS transporter